jgi:predicted glycoside hydrolase/deacetylase ChbG (UPF0249 family)
MKTLIINADDLGAAEGTVEAITSLYEKGLVTSTTALVNLPDWPRAATYLKKHPNLGAGVHLVMNDGSPILPADRVRSLVDRQGRFYDGNALLLRYGRLRLSELEDEWRAQILKFIADSGRQPDHLDLHCHYPYVFPAWFRVSLKLGCEFGSIPVRLPFDDALVAKAALLAKSAGFPAWYVRWNGGRYQKMVHQFGLQHTNYWESSFSQDGNRTPEYLLQLLDRLPNGSTELLCHPGTLKEWRRQDYQALLDPRVKSRLHKKDILLINYQNIA